MGGIGDTCIATSTAGRATAARVGISDVALHLDVATITSCAAISALGRLSDIGYTASYKDPNQL